MMTVKIQSNQVELNKAIEAQIQRKLKFALSRFEPYISKISISLLGVIKDPDIDGVKENSATRCCLHISLANLPVIEVEDIQTDLYCAIDRVIQKASRILARKVISLEINEAK